MKSIPVVYGYEWDGAIVEAARKSKKLLRASGAIPGGAEPCTCNLKCIFCFTEGGRRHKDHFPVNNEEVLAFMREASEHAYDSALMNYFFVSEGEPSLNTGLSDVLKETRKLGGTMTIFSNLYYLSDDLVKTFSEIDNLFICGKMYGITAATNDYLTGVAGSHKKMLENIERLANNGLAEQGRLGVQCVVTRRNYDEVFEIFKWARSRKIVPHIMMYREQGLGSRHPELSITADELLALHRKCSQYDKDEYGYEWTARLPLLGIGECHIPGVNLYMVNNADVTVCAGDARKYGNYRKQSVTEMLNGALYNEVASRTTGCPWVAELIRDSDLVKLRDKRKIERTRS